MNVLVTGAGGFIGSHLTEALVRAGPRVRAMVRYNSRNDIGLLRYAQADVRAACELYPGSLTSVESVNEAVRGTEVVFHLGALIAIPYSYHDPRDYVETNVIGTLNVLTACRAAGVRRLIHTSTSECYGSALTVPISESHPLQAQSPYAASKIAADKMAESFHRSFDLPVATIRPFNTFGPRQSARAVIPALMVQALSRPRIEVGDVTPTRDFTYVSDTVAAFIRMADADGVVGEVTNVGCGQEISIGQLARRIMRVVGRSVDLHQDAARLRPEQSEVVRLCADATRAHQRLAWRPQVDLDSGLQNTVEWIREHPELYDETQYQR